MGNRWKSNHLSELQDWDLFPRNRQFRKEGPKPYFTNLPPGNRQYRKEEKPEKPRYLESLALNVPMYSDRSVKLVKDALFAISGAESVNVYRNQQKVTVRYVDPDEAVRRLKGIGKRAEILHPNQNTSSVAAPWSVTSRSADETFPRSEISRSAIETFPRSEIRKSAKNNPFKKFLHYF